MTFLKGPLCELRVLDPDDAMQVGTFTDYVNRGLTTQHLFTGSIPMRSKDYAAKWDQERKAGDIQFGVWVDDVFIGTCGLHAHRDIYKSWEFRILLFNPEYLGRGIGTEATSLCVDYAFTRLNAHRVWLGVNEENKGAVNCYRKVGFTVEGLLRDEIFVFGHYVNAVRMGILEEEWKSRSTVKAE